MLNFENIAPYPSGNNVAIENYYNGGTSSIGTSGPNYGVAFTSNALVLCLNTPGTTCSNTSRGGYGDPNSQEGALYWLNGANTYMNVAAGFTTGFSFYYADPNTGGASVTVYSGLSRYRKRARDHFAAPNSGWSLRCLVFRRRRVLSLRAGRCVVQRDGDVDLLRRHGELRCL